MNYTVLHLETYQTWAWHIARTYIHYTYSTCARDHLISNFPTSILTPCIKVYHRVDVYGISLSTGLQEAVNTINDLSSLQLLFDLTAQSCRIQCQNNPASQVMDLEISASARTKNTHHLHPSPLVSDHLGRERFLPNLRILNSMLDLKRSPWI